MSRTRITVESNVCARVRAWHAKLVANNEPIGMVVYHMPIVDGYRLPSGEPPVLVVEAEPHADRVDFKFRGWVVSVSVETAVDTALPADIDAAAVINLALDGYRRLLDKHYPQHHGLTP